MSEEAAARRFFPTRSRGQNFLHDREVAARFAAAVLAPSSGPGRSRAGGGESGGEAVGESGGEAPESPAVVEIGAGKGAITLPLLAAGARVLAVEVDPRLAAVLRERAGERGFASRLAIVTADALELDFAAALRDFGAAPPLPVCGNLPFSVGARLLLRLLEVGLGADHGVDDGEGDDGEGDDGGGDEGGGDEGGGDDGADTRAAAAVEVGEAGDAGTGAEGGFERESGAGGALFSSLTLTLQREVAERVTARCGDPEYGALSVVVRQALSPRLLFRIHPGAFRPRPRVVAAAVRLTPRPDPPPVGDPQRFRALTRALFAHRRKTLGNSIARLPDPELRARVAAAAATLGLDLARRPEELPVADFAALSRWANEPANEPTNEGASEPANGSEPPAGGR